jgi:hypothetical protein
MEERPGKNVLGGVLLSLGLVILAMIFVYPILRGNLYAIAPLQIVLGSVAFILAISAVVVIFQRLALQDTRQALALPEGSVRALIALILLIVFVIFANIIYGQMQRDVSYQSVSFSGLTSNQVADLPGPVITQSPIQESAEGGPYFEGAYSQRSSSAEAKALGQQIIASLMTLVSAIAAFYFGVNAVKDRSPEAPNGAGREGGPGVPQGPVVDGKSGVPPQGPVVDDQPGVAPQDPVVVDQPGVAPEEPVAVDQPVVPPQGPVVDEPPGVAPQGPVVVDQPGVAPQDPVADDQPVVPPQEPVVDEKPVAGPQSPVVEAESVPPPQERVDEPVQPGESVGEPDEPGPAAREPRI